MMLRSARFAAGLLLCLPTGCSDNPAGPAYAYRRDPGVSGPQGEPRDSTTTCFPAALSGPSSREGGRTASPTSCEKTYREASRYLFTFGAPVWANYYLNRPGFRLLWWGRYGRPTLLTLHQTPEGGGELQTQFLSRHPRQLSAPPLPPWQDPGQPDAPPAEKARRLKERQLLASNEEFLAAQARARPPLVVLNAETVTLSPAQYREFTALLTRAGFWEQPSCPAPDAMDGANWLLEAQQPRRYYVARRHSPGPADPFRRCGEYLLRLSPARAGEQY